MNYDIYLSFYRDILRIVVFVTAKSAFWSPSGIGVNRNNNTILNPCILERDEYPYTLFISIQGIKTQS